MLYCVYGWRKHIEIICTLLYAKPVSQKEKKEAAGTESAVSDAEVMGSTRYVYLDENAGMPEYIGVRYISASCQTVHSHPLL